MSQTKLIETVRDCNREITPADRHGLLKLIEQQAARIAELESENRELGEFVIALGGFWGKSKSKLVGELSLAEVINRAFDESRIAANGAEQRKVPAEIVMAIQAYGDARADNVEAVSQLTNVITLIRASYAAPVASGPRYDWSVSGMKQSETGNWVMAEKGDKA